MTRKILFIASLLYLGINGRMGVAQTKAQRSVPETLLVKVVDAHTSPEKHGYIRVMALLKVTRVLKSQSKVRVGQLLYIGTMHMGNLPTPWPLPVLQKGAVYKAFLARYKPPRPGSATTCAGVRGNPAMYDPAAGGASFEKIKTGTSKF